MPKIRILDIEIEPRQRKELTKEDVDRRAASFQRFGQLQPIILRKKEGKMVLVAGFIRTQAALSLGWDEIRYELQTKVDDILSKEMELEENIESKALEWYEEAAAVAEIHALHMERDPEWNMRKTAEVVGKSVGTVSQSVQLDTEVKSGGKVKEEKTLVGALKKLDTKKRLEKRVKAMERKAAGKGPSFPARILQGDARDLVKELEDESFDAIITNFPFGVDLTYKGGEKPYYDDEDYIVELVMEVLPHCYRVLKPDSWMVAFFDVRKITYSSAQLRAFDHAQVMVARLLADETISKETYETIRLDLLKSMGLAFWAEQAGFNWVQKVPAIWTKPNKTQGLIGDPNKGLISSYEAFIFMAKGQPVLMKKGLQNHFPFEVDLGADRVHAVQMPTEFCKHLVSMICLGGGRILDLFAGSGATGLGALEQQCEYLGFELDEEFCRYGNMRLQEHIHAGVAGGKQGTVRSDQQPQEVLPPDPEEL